MSLDKMIEITPAQEETDPIQCILNCLEHVRGEIIDEVRRATNDNDKETRNILNAYMCEAKKELLASDKYTQKEAEKAKLELAEYEPISDILMGLSQAFTIADFGKDLALESTGEGLASLENANKLLGAYYGFMGIDFLYANKKRHDTRQGGIATKGKYELQRNFVIKLYSSKKWTVKQAADFIEPKLTIFMEENGLKRPVKSNRYKWIQDRIGDYRKKQKI